MTTDFDSAEFSPTDWISQTEAATLRGVTRQAIARLIKRGRVRSMVIGGHTVVYKPDIVSFEPKPAGRPRHND